jgi:4-hydroxy-tetrahydrodipicolinate reductase
MNPIRLAIAGCTGRTGSAVLRQAVSDSRFAVVAALAHKSDPRVGQDVGAIVGSGPLGLPITHECRAVCDVLIEFTNPQGCAAWAGWCAENRVALVSGTTGLGASEEQQLRQAATCVPVLWSPNMSIGVNLLLVLVEEVARRLGGEWDVEICEAHHRHKVDAPSGTAKALLSAVCTARGAEPQQVGVFGRSGVCGPRRSGEVGVHALRLGGLVGQHVISFASATELLRLEHQALSRDAFAAGALHAACWLAGRPAGWYAMRDLLGWGR